MASAEPAHPPLLVIVTGLPCTGKTRLAQTIASTWRLPLLHKDGIKEVLFDTLGWSDREWSKKLGAACYALLFHLLEMELAAGRSLVLESNFRGEQHTPRFLELKQRYGFKPFQVQLVADGPALFERFKQRSESGVRHPGHVDTHNYAEFEATLKAGRLQPLEVGGTYIEIDTTDFSRVDWSPLVEQIGHALG